MLGPILHVPSCIQVFTLNPAYCKCAAVGIQAAGSTINWAVANIAGEPISRCNPTRPSISIFIDTNLIRLRSINTFEPNFCSSYNNRVTVDDARDTGNRLRCFGLASKKYSEQSYDAKDF